MSAGANISAAGYQTSEEEGDRSTQNYSDDLMGLPDQSNTGLDTAIQIIYNIIVPIVCAFGIVGIIVTVIVLSKKNMRTSTNCYLMALSITDLIFLILFITILIENRFEPYTQSHYFYLMYQTHATFFMHITLMASIWLTVMLGVERYIAICQPFMAAKLCTVVKARIIVLVIYGCALICRLPNFWENKIIKQWDSTTNSTIYYMDSSDFANDYHYNTVYPWIVDVTLSSLIPFFLLLVLNVKLILEVRKSTRYLQRNMMMSSGAAGSSAGVGNVAAREELQITVMLVSVVIVFFVCQAPYVTYTAISSFNLYAVTSSIILFRSITTLLLALKSAINFLLYCWFSEKFRATLRHLFCSHRCLKLIGREDKSQNCNYYNMRRISTTNTRDTTI